MAVEKIKPKKHPSYYNQYGTKVPSVTTVIGNNLGWNKNVLMAWARKMALQGIDPDAIRDEAASVGTLAHFFVECYINHDIPDTEGYTEEQIAQAQNALDAFKEWEAEYNMTIQHSELQLVSEKYQFGGTIDMIGNVGNGIYVVDLKTSKAVYPDHVIQVSAYKQLYEENYDKVEGIFVLRVDKETGEFHYKNIGPDDINAGWEVFKKCLEINKYKEQLERIK